MTFHRSVIQEAGGGGRNQTPIDPYSCALFLTPHLFLTVLLFIILFFSSIYLLASHFNFQPQIQIPVNKTEAMTESVKLDTKRCLPAIHNYNQFLFLEGV